jgi:hypothetical protein
MAVGTLVACAQNVGSPGDGELRVGPLGEPVAIVENVGYYPACGNETIEVNGVIWFPFTPSDDSTLPADPLAATSGGAAAASGVSSGPFGMARSDWAPTLPRVAAPGPGDDVGTLVVFEDGVAYWRSHSGDLDSWLTDQPRNYAWVC